MGRVITSAGDAEGRFYSSREGGPGSKTTGGGEIRIIGGAIKRYWWGVLLSLIGAYLLVSTVFGFINLIAMDAASSYEPEISRAIVGWGWNLATFVVWLIGGASILYTGVMKILKNRKADTGDSVS